MFYQVTPVDKASTATSCAEVQEMNLKSRWQDWVALVAGLYAVLSPIMTTTEASATWTMVGLGALLALAAAWSVVRPDAVVSEWTHVALGALLVLSPWVMGFADLTGLSWTAWVTGAVAVVMGLWALPESRSEHVRQVTAH